MIRSSFENGSGRAWGLIVRGISSPEKKGLQEQIPHKSLGRVSTLQNNIVSRGEVIKYSSLPRTRQTSIL